MAAWLKPFVFALAAALCLHLAGIAGIRLQLQSVSSALDQRNDPLFTRTISAATVAAPPAPVVATQAPQKPARIAPALDSVPSQATPSVAQVTPLAPLPIDSQNTVSPTRAENTQAVATVAPTTPTTPTTALDSVALTIASAQTLTTAPIGNTDSLLITGDWPGDTRVSYRLTGFYQGELFGKGEVQWTRSGQNNERYQVRVTVDAGLVEMRMTSQGRVSPEGLLPEVFEESTKRVLQKSRARALKLEPEALVLNDGRRLSRPAVQPMAVQDSVSQFLDLGHRIGLGRDRLEEGQTIKVWLGRPGGLDEWLYDVGPEEVMQLPQIGPVKVHSLKPRPLANPRGPISMSIWLAPSLQYLPAKIRIQLNPEAYVELIAEQLQQR